MGVGLIIAIPATIIASKFINHGQFPLVLTIAVLTNIAGLFIITIPHIVGLIAGITLVGAGYMCVYQALMIWVKNLYPENQRAQLEGVRLFFYVCIPMVIGPAIGSLVVKAFGFPMVNEYGEAGFSASNALFFVAAGMALLTFIPIYIAAKIQKRTAQLQESPETINQ
jgi:predicted MFS family arabinose efflux permease